MKAREQLDGILNYFYENKYVENGIEHDTISTDKSVLDITGDVGELYRILNKLKTDGYLHMYPQYRFLPDGKKDIGKGLFTHWNLTFEGRLFWESGGYKKEAFWKNISEIPKNYWWLIGIIAFAVGFWSDIFKDRLKQEKQPCSQEQEQEPPIIADSQRNRKKIDFVLDTLNPKDTTPNKK